MRRLSAILAKNLRFYREKSGLTQRQLADLSGMSKAAITDWEGGSASPSLSNIGQVAEALGIADTDLLAGGEPPKPITVRATPLEAVEILRKFVKQARKLKGPLVNQALEEGGDDE